MGLWSRLIGVREHTKAADAFVHAAKAGDVTVLGRLGIAKADEGLKNKALLFSAQAGHSEAVRILVAGGANANAEVQGVTAIFVASQNGHLDALEALLKVSDKVNANVLDGDTALHAATYKGHLDVVRALLAAGAKVNARGCDGATALMIASQDGAAELAKIGRAHV